MLKVSVVIPIYKTEKFLKTCVDSVLSQTYHNIEIILVNDGSPDNSTAICEDYARKDARVKVVNKKNGGLSDARNAGIACASGEYIMFIDSDDWLCDDSAIERIVDKLNETNSDMLIFGYKKYNMAKQSFYACRMAERERTKCTNFAELINSGRFGACAWDKVVRRDLIIANELRFVVGQCSEDIEWCIKLLLCAKTIDILSIAPYVYRQNPNSLSSSSNIKQKNLEDMLSVIEKYSTPTYLSQDSIAYLLSLEFVLLLVLCVCFSAQDIKPYEGRIKNLWFLFKYAGHRRVQIVKKINFLGIFGLRFIFKSYVKFIRPAR